MLQRWLVVIIGLPLLLAALLLCPDWVTVIVVCGSAAAAAYELLHTAGKKVPKCVYAFTILAAVAQEWVIYDAHTWQFYDSYQSVGMIRILCVPLALVRRFLPLIAEAAGRFRRKLRIDVFQLEVTAAAPDPAAAALCFGGANAFIGMIWPLVEQNFNVKERRLRTRVDFDAERPSVYLYAAATLTAGQALALGLRLTTRFLAEFSKYRAEAGSPATSKQKEAV